MIFAVINIIICAILVYISFSIDKNVKGNSSNASLVNLFLFLGVIFLFMAITIILCLDNSVQHTLLSNPDGTQSLHVELHNSFPAALFSGRFTYLIMGWFAVCSCSYMLVFPDYKKYKTVTFFQVLLFILAVYMVFFAPNAFTSVTLAKGNFLRISSGIVFKGKLSGAFNVSWLTFYNFLYRGLIPAFVCVMVIVRAENTTSKLKQQTMLQNVFGIMLSWVVFWYINLCSEIQPVLNNFAPIGFIPELYFFARSNSNDEIVDARILLMGFVRLLIGFVAPMLASAVFFIILLPVSNVNIHIFELLIYVAIAFVFFVFMLFRRKFKNSELFRNKMYSEDFERDITSIDFNLEANEITGSVFNVFKKYVGSSSMKILIEDGVGNMICIYSSDGDKSFSTPIDQSVADVLLNNHHQIVFREFAQTNNSVASVRSKILGLMDSTNSDAMIMLSEGRQVIGLILLGKKISGNIYSEYDYEVFNKFYSNFFVVGYYVKNIMNEAVVGTVKREIRMSGQIITSIQENMDLIKSKKVDAGYLMVPAHNIGGEFVDMIRLTDTRHIFVIGALSGKGIAASMGMVILKSIIRTFLSETTDFKLLVAKVNTFIRENLPKGTFFAGTFGILDFNTDTMYYINCGIPALLVYTRAYNNVIEVQGEGHILGFVKDVAPYIKVKKVKLSEGDIVMIVTDGIIDTKSLRGDIFGKTRTQTALMENSGYPAEKMAKFTYDALVEFTSKELENDITILVMKYLGNQAQA